MKKEVKLFILILALLAIAGSFTGRIFGNYFNEVYNVTSSQRGFIEFPRELPGVLVLFFVTIVSFLGDIRLAIIAQIMAFVGILTLGLCTPTYAIMLFFIFVNSFGVHLFMPLETSIGLSLVDDESKMGMRMGQFKSVTIAFYMLGSILVYTGFKTGVFDFADKIRLPFVIGAVLIFIVALLFYKLLKIVGHDIQKKRKVKFIFRKKYKYYYLVTIVYGVQKQIMIVYGPWVLIHILGKGADTISGLVVVGSFIGIFFTRKLGRWIDKYGTKTMLYADGISFIVVYLIYGAISGAFSSGLLAKTGWPVMILFVIFILDSMSNQMTIIRNVYLKQIAISKEDIMPTLSMGLCLDHVVAITAAVIGGVIWDKYGPQYIFYFAALLSLVNIYVAHRVKRPTSAKVTA